MTRIAIVSTAHVHAAAYAEILRHTPGVDLRIVDRVEELGDWAPDGVVVTSENSRHRELVVAAADRGAHVLCEKPLATTEADARAMIDHCARAGVGLMVAYPVRFSPEARRLAELATTGALGEIVSAIGVNTGQLPTVDWFSDPARSGGGALVDHIVHIADLLDGMLGLRAQRVHAVANRILHADRTGEGAETAGLVTIEYAGGVVATIDCSWSLPDTAPRWGGLQLEVAGTAGSVWLDPFAQTLRGVSADDGRTTYDDLGEDANASMLAAFLRAVQGEGPFEPDGAVGLRTLQVVLAARESAATGRSVEVAPA